MSSNIKMLIDKSTKEHSIDEMIHYIIHNKIKITLYPENEQYLKYLYKYNYINYKLFNVNKYLQAILNY